MGDLISRQVVIETLCNHYEVNNAVQNATIDECIMLVKNIVRDMITGKGERWKGRTVDDLISRRAALEAMDTWDKFGCDQNGKLVRCDDDKHYVPYVHYDDMVHVIKSLPSEEPKKGRWIFTRYYVWECSECGKNPTRGMGYVQRNSELFRYCPNCGAEMEENER